MNAFYIRVSLLAAAAALFWGCNNEELEMLSGRHSNQHTIQAYFDLSGTRAILEGRENSYDMSAKWLANDHIRVFYNTGEKYSGTDPIVVSEVTPDGLGATFQYNVPSAWGKHDTYDVKIFTIPCYPAAKDEKLFFNASLIRQPLETFQLPVYSEGEVNEYGVLNATFHHYYAYELLHISNTSESDIEFSLLGFENDLDGLWYKEKGSICIDNGLFVVDAPSTRDPRRESDPITVKPGESRIIVSAYVPNGGLIHGAKMVTKINGEYVHSSNTKTSGVELKAGHAYHMYAGWDGEELKFWDHAEEPLNVEMLSAEINPKTLMGTFTGTVTNSSIEGLKSGFLFLKEGNHPEDYVEYDSTFSDEDSFGLTLTFNDFMTIAGDAPVKGTYNVSAYVFDGKGERFHSKMIQFTIDKDQPESMVPVPEIVDLGLSVKWASFNLGATKPEEFGDYYAWGETIPYYLSLDPLVWRDGMTRGYDWWTYRWSGQNGKRLTKYCTNPEYGRDGFTDDKVELDPEDDAAFVNLGTNWRMPTRSEINELIDDCDWQWTTREGIEGYQVTSKIAGYADRSIFLPAAGNWFEVNPPSIDGNANYWSSSLYVDEPNKAYQLYFNWVFTERDLYQYRNLGYPIRPVYDDSDVKPEIKTPEAIDLGLPSGLKWASFNLGATKPEECGYLYAWGETEPKTVYEFSTYKWCKGSYTTLTKYCPTPYYGYNGFTDNKAVLDLEDDAAHMNLGGKWRMPTSAERDELIERCTSKWVSVNGVYGFEFTAPNGASFFLPADGDKGRYWTSDLSDPPLYGIAFRIDASSENNINWGNLDFNSRAGGLFIRPVYGDPVTVTVESVSIDKTAIVLAIGGETTLDAIVLPVNATNKKVSWISDNESIATVTSSGVVKGVTPGSAIITVTTVDGGKTATCTVTVKDPSSPYTVATPEAVDLGLPSGLKWASFNLGASVPEEYGDYYAWGETEPYYWSLSPLTWKEGKEAGYGWASYKWSNSITKYNSTDRKIVLDPEDDAAHVNLGGKWRMPTSAELDELWDSCSWDWTQMNGVKGRKVTGPNGNSIFLPAAGYWNGTSLIWAGSRGYWWSSSVKSIDPYCARHIFFNNDHVTWDSYYSYSRCYGESIRPVYE